MSASHSCGSTGSPFGPFPFRAYEDGNYKTTYAREFELAGFNQLFPEYPSFALPRIETGARDAGSAQTIDPYVPPVLLKAISWLESGWAQAANTVPYGTAGDALVSHDCGYGLMQVTTGMQNISGVPTLDQAMIGGHSAFNIARGAKILAEKWNLSPEFRPIVGTRDPSVIENWYYALWGYNGFAFQNHPLNPSYSQTRAPYSCGPAGDSFGHDRTQYPYQEIVLGCAARPPVKGGTQLWPPQPMKLPDLTNPDFAGPLSTDKWNPCSYSGQCAPLDMPTPTESNKDATVVTVTRTQVLGTPVLTVSPGTIETNSLPPTSGKGSFMITNIGTGILSWRATSNQPWLKLSAMQGVALGTDIGDTGSTVTFEASATGLASGRYTAEITIESLSTARSPGKITVAFTAHPDGSLIRGSGTSIYMMSGGLKRHIPNGHTFEAYHFNWGAITTIADTSLAAVPTGDPLLNVLADGNLIKGPGAEIYVMDGGQKRHVTSPETFNGCGYGWGDYVLLSDALVSSIPTGEQLTFDPCPSFVPPDGSMVRGSGTSIFVMSGGLRRHLPNLATLQARSLEWGDVNSITESQLNGIPRGKALLDTLTTGFLVKGTGASVYVIDAGIKHHVTSLEVLNGCGYSFEAVFTLPDATINAIPMGTAMTNASSCPRFSPPDGSLLTADGTAVLAAQTGLKRLVPNTPTLRWLGYRPENIDTVHNEYLADLPTGDPLLNVFANGQLVKGSGPEAYVMQDGIRRHVTTLDIFLTCGYNWGAIQNLPDSDLASIPVGAPLTTPPCPAATFPQGAILRGSSVELFVVDSTVRRKIVSPDTFNGCGYQWGNISSVADGILNSLPIGAPLGGAPCP